MVANDVDVRVEPDERSEITPSGSILSRALADASAFDLTYSQLMRLDGWVAWLGYPPVPDGLSIVPAPEELLWGEPYLALATIGAVAVDYAARRGAEDFISAADVLRRECPVAIVIPNELHPNVAVMAAELTALGVPMLEGTDDLGRRLASLPPFRARREARLSLSGVVHDPVLSWQTINAAPDDHMGAHSLSSFVLHAEAERDTTTVTGTPSDRIGIEIGVLGDGIGIAESAFLETVASEIPSFLDGVDAQRSGQALQISWLSGARPSAELLGELWRVWLKAFFGASMVDVRIGYGPPQGRSAFLVDMRERARAYREIRDRP